MSATHDRPFNCGVIGALNVLIGKNNFTYHTIWVVSSLRQGEPLTHVSYVPRRDN
jgi:hypothetical protein